ncbi:hypothetical protein GDO86_018944, partial [Hymenochirus boettgeri]
DIPSFPHSFLDEIPTEDECLSPDLLPPPPPPPPVILKSPKKPPHNPPASDLTHCLSSELQKLELVSPPAPRKLNFEPTAPPPGPIKNTLVSCSQQKRVEEVSGKQNINGYTSRTENVDTAPLTNDICAFCHKSISPSTAVIEAMKKQYHAACFTCRNCHRLLAGQLYYQKDGKPTCDHCYKETLEKCAKCQGLIMQHIVRAMGNGYHPECFTCVVCQRRIADESFAVDEFNDVHCAEDYYRKYAPICSLCHQPIIPTDGRDSFKIECLGRSFHENCYRCEGCHVSLSLEPTDSGCYPINDHLLCKSCHLSWKDKDS